MKKIREVKFSGIGIKSIEKLEELGLNSTLDMLFYFPKKYLDKTNKKKISDIQIGESVVVAGEITHLQEKRTPRHTILTALLEDESGSVELIWFNQIYLKKMIKTGTKATFFGAVKHGIRKQISAPEIIFGKKVESLGIEAVYALPDMLSKLSFSGAIEKILSDFPELYRENLPHEFKLKFNLMSREQAVREVHFPTNSINLKKARKRFLYEELYMLEYEVLSKRYNVVYEKYHFSGRKELVSQFVKSLHFELTRSQKMVIKEIYSELIEGRVVNRLIQGDVGSGKTIVAIILMLFCVENGYQCVMMAPTGILAEQHFIELCKMLKGIDVNISILKGDSKESEKLLICEELKNGNSDIIVGTHALIEERVIFQNLGLTIIDEQHKFGVEQRDTLSGKAKVANLVVMSATPIPRSLALTVYGDLDVSIISELPPGRQPITTKALFFKTDLYKVWEFTQKKLSEGRQAYVVCPLIEDSENGRFSIESLKPQIESIFSNFTVGVLIGKMKTSEKNSVMDSYSSGIIDILLTTTVVEVGVNVPNSTVMVILGSDRFGLSQLHQLRGRIGRGIHRSYCFLYTETENETTLARMNVMERTADGFEIAEEDLKHRNTGEVLGIKQSGKSDLKIVNLIRDIKAIKEVRDFVKSALEK
ncbi:MAG: ATP-dependent DNA helicase RecG [Fusobacteria bacterium]|nr:ATP-dependent DNA helicase RecG [Fusobacteriota bacterium]